ncbi:DnaD domain-containing protein [Candidatus Amarolinea aalborgensis]|jgi:DnaD/phage-associated family protein|uniref:DnaD domain-containing protein n=1 Tax=Candidatus Amarolinea aalborgensis TaxID=2249329 RepID=UPI003BFA0659
MKGFPGFPAGELPLVALPQFAFTDLLPTIDHLGEMKVTLFCLWRISEKPGSVRFVTQDELLTDARLRSGLPDRAAVQEGLERAVARGSLLHLVVERFGEREDWYFINDEMGRTLQERVRSGVMPEFDDPLLENRALRAERPNIFVLYEQNIGLLQPLLADELRHAERDYPLEWLEAAFREAVVRNKRTWRYVQAILQRWALEGREAPMPERKPGGKPKGAKTAAAKAPRKTKKLEKRSDPFDY